MKNIYLLLLMMFGFGVLHAQSDPKAKAILDNVSSKVKNFKGITAGFTYTTKNKNKVKKGTVNGSISIKGQKYLIKQGSMQIISDGKKIWNYGGDKEVTVTDADDDSKTLSPQKLLTNFYDKDFSYKLVGSDAKYNEIEMMPIDKRKNFKKVNVFVDKSKNIITKATIIDKADNIVEFELKNVNTNAVIQDNLFTFDAKKYPGVEVIEQ